MLKWCWTLGIFKFHCVQCWDKFPSSLTFKCWDLGGAVASIIIPWGKTMISEEFKEVLLPFSTWGFLEDILRMVQLSITMWCSHPAGHHLCNTRCSHTLGPPRCNTICWEPRISGIWGQDVAQLWVLWTHLGGLPTLLSCSSPESPSCRLPGPALYPWCHVDHWEKVKTLHYGALKANHFSLRQWIALKFSRVFLRL